MVWRKKTIHILLFKAGGNIACCLQLRSALAMFMNASRYFALFVNKSFLKMPNMLSVHTLLWLITVLTIIDPFFGWLQICLVFNLSQIISNSFSKIKNKSLYLTTLESAIDLGQAKKRFDLFIFTNVEPMFIPESRVLIRVDNVCFKKLRQSAVV